MTFNWLQTVSHKTSSVTGNHDGGLGHAFAFMASVGIGYGPLFDARLSKAKWSSAMFTGMLH